MRKGTCEADDAFAQHECSMKCNECEKFKENIITDYNKRFAFARVAVWTCICIGMMYGAFVLGFKFLSLFCGC